MGKAHINIFPEILDKLNSEPYKGQVFINKVTEFGDGTLYVGIESDRIRDGYQGFLEMYFVEDEIRFRRDQDT